MKNIIKENLLAKILIYISSVVILFFGVTGIFIGVKNHKQAQKTAGEYTRIISQEAAKSLESALKPEILSVNACSSTLTTLIAGNSPKLKDMAESQLFSIWYSEDFVRDKWFILSNEVIKDTLLNDGAWVKYSINRKTSVKKSIFKEVSDINLKVSPYLQSIGVTVTEPYTKNNRKFIDIYSPIKKVGNKVGVTGVTIDLNMLSHKFTQNKDILKKRGSLRVINSRGTIIINGKSSLIGSDYFDMISKADNYDKFMSLLKTSSGFLFDLKLNGEDNYSYYTKTSITENSSWFVEVSFSKKVLIAETHKSIMGSVIFALVSISLLVFFTYLIAKKLISPIRKVNDVLYLLTKGNLKEVSLVDINTGDELQVMGDRLKQLVKGLRETEKFALEIGSGKLDNEYKLLSEEDQLGKALIAMRESLIKNIEEEQKRKEKDEQVAWATRGIAKFGEILRQDNTDMKKMGYNVISNLISYLNVNQGAMFVLNNENEKDTYFELVTAIAYDRQKFMEKRIEIGQGLVGRCIFEKKTIFLKEVPEDYVYISSGLGDARPSSILIVPCILNDEVFGVIELASFTPFKQYEIEFVEKLGESIGSTISSVKISEKTTKLLEASKFQSEELATQEEELRQNLEEMKATQEELKRQMDENAQIREDLQKQSALLDSLLETIPDFIYFKDEESRFLKISKSMLSIFNASSIDEVIGKSDFDYHTPENAKEFFEEEKRIMETRQGIINKIIKEIKLDGSIVWNSITKLPLITKDGVCIGTFGISKDVTAIKQMEIDANKQKAELSGILDAIKKTAYTIEYDIDGVILDVNDTLLRALGVDKTEIVGTNHKDWFKGKNFSDKAYEELREKMRSGIMTEQENSFTIGNKIYHFRETYAPIFDDDNKVVKVFEVAFDISAGK